MSPILHTMKASIATSAVISARSIAFMLVVVGLALPAAGDPSEAEKTSDEIHKRAQETIKRIKKDLCANRPSHEPRPNTDLIGPLCADFEPMEKKSFSDMQLIQRHVDRTLKIESDRQREIEMYMFYKQVASSLPISAEVTLAKLKLKVAVVQLAIAFSEASKGIETFIFQPLTNEHLKDPKLQLAISKLIDTMTRLESSAPDIASSNVNAYFQYKYNHYNNNKALLEKALIKNKNTVPKLDNNELSRIRDVIVYAPVEKSVLATLKEKEASLIAEVKPLEEAMNSASGDLNAVIGWEVKTKVTEIRNTRSNYIECGMSAGELLALAYYTGRGYYLLNSALRENEDKRSVKGRKVVATVSPILNSALDKLKPYQGIVRRGAILPPELLAEHKKIGNTVEYKSFVSSSIATGGDVRRLVETHRASGGFIM